MSTCFLLSEDRYFLNEPDLDVFFRVLYEGKAYIIYANTGSFKCYECGGVGHKRLTCPHKAGTSGETAGPSTAAENGTEDTLPPVVEKRDAQIVKQSENVTDNGHDEEVVAETEFNERVYRMMI